MKLVLDISNMTDDFFEDCCLLGIVAPMNNYSFCFLLNKSFRYNFKFFTEVERMSKKRSYYFPIFSHEESHRTLVHYIYHNQNDGDHLLPEFKHIDFLWLAKGELINSGEINDLIQSIRTLNGVQLVTEIKINQLKNKGNLVF